MRHSHAQIDDAYRKNWLDAKARGKTRFVWREAIGSILIWLVVLPAVEIFEHRGQWFSPLFLTLWLVILPIFLLGGYLTGNWRWKDLEKKYPEAS
jgi:hypothetical protein